LLPGILDGREIAAIGYRVVHGGARYQQHSPISADLLDELNRITSLSPEHLPAEIELIEAFQDVYREPVHIACFDTAFHAGLPTAAKTLPIPRKYQEKGVRRYGFHGLSYEYLMSRLAEVGSPGEAQGRVILAHLGNGSSLAALRDGQCVDTSMAFSPASGLPMGSRTGDIDPGLLCHLAEQESLSTDQLRALVFKQSGLLGISETSSDVRDLLATEQSDHRAAEALEHFCYQTRKWIGAFAAAINGLDTLVFSGGIGANSAEIRERICAGLQFLGVSPGSETVKVHVIPTDEELVIARIAKQFIQDTHPSPH
jgi:acetate kinase